MDQDCQVLMVFPDRKANLDSPDCEDRQAQEVSLVPEVTKEKEVDQDYRDRMEILVLTDYQDNQAHLVSKLGLTFSFTVESFKLSVKITETMLSFNQFWSFHKFFRTKGRIGASSVLERN